MSVLDDVGASHEENEARLRTRRISEACDRFHHDSEDSECANGSCQCWCHE
jgi:hypothetical protein